ncbi:MAG TPA: hypothetical protein PKK56_00750 [archaeon]|nr:hypothetical protein [archaeon]
MVSNKGYNLVLIIVIAFVVGFLIGWLVFGETETIGESYIAAHSQKEQKDIIDPDYCWAKCTYINNITGYESNWQISGLCTTLISMEKQCVANQSGFFQYGFLVQGSPLFTSTSSERICVCCGAVSCPCCGEN